MLLFFFKLKKKLNFIISSNSKYSLHEVYGILYNTGYIIKWLHFVEITNSYKHTHARTHKQTLT